MGRTVARLLTLQGQQVSFEGRCWMLLSDLESDPAKLRMSDAQLASATGDSVTQLGYRLRWLRERGHLKSTRRRVRLALGWYNVRTLEVVKSEAERLADERWREEAVAKAAQRAAERAEQAKYAWRPSGQYGLAEAHAQDRWAFQARNHPAKAVVPLPRAEEPWPRGRRRSSRRPGRPSDVRCLATSMWLKMQERGLACGTNAEVGALVGRSASWASRAIKVLVDSGAVKVRYATVRFPGGWWNRRRVEDARHAVPEGEERCEAGLFPRPEVDGTRPRDHAADLRRGGVDPWPWGQRGADRAPGTQPAAHGHQGRGDGVPLPRFAERR